MGKVVSSYTSAKFAASSINNLPSGFCFFFSCLHVDYIFFFFLYSVLRIEPRVSLKYSPALSFPLEFSRAWRKRKILLLQSYIYLSFLWTFLDSSHMNHCVFYLPLKPLNHHFLYTTQYVIGLCAPPDCQLLLPSSWSKSILGRLVGILISSPDCWLPQRGRTHLCDNQSHQRLPVGALFNFLTH